MSTVDTTDTSLPSVPIVSDDAGNLDASWLNANYPSFPPSRNLPFAFSRTHTDALSYSIGSGAIPLHRDEHGFVVPALTDMAGNLLPRFERDGQGICKGLLIEPASSNFLQYDRVGLTSGVQFSGCGLGTTTRLSVDGVSQIQAIGNAATDSVHGVTLNQVGQSSGYLSVSGALFSPTQRYYAIQYTLASSKALTVGVVDTVALTFTPMGGVCAGRVYQDLQGWVWVNVQLGPFPAIDTGTVSILCAADALGTTTYISGNTVWFMDAWQLECSAQSTSSVFASATGVSSRAAEAVESVIPAINQDNWLGSANGNGTVIVEGYIPWAAMSAPGFSEMWRFSQDSQNYLAVGYLTTSGTVQLALYLVSGGQSSMYLVGAAALAPEAFFRVALAYTAASGSLAVTGFALNGRVSLAAGAIGGALPSGVATSLQFINNRLPLVISRITAYNQALATNQLKYLTAV
jgi:hypothetical protein